MHGNEGDAWYTADGANWYRSAAPPKYFARHAASVWVFKGGLHVGLGSVMDDAAKFLADLWRLDPR